MSYCTIPGAYSLCMQGMHCMPSHLTKKDNNDLSKYMSELTTKSNQVSTVTGIHFQVEVAINSLA